MGDDNRYLAFQTLTPDEAATFLALVGTILPHQRPILRKTVEDTALALDSNMVSDLGLRGLVRAGLKELSQRAQTDKGGPFEALDPEAQAEVAQAIEASDFFQTMVHLAKYDFYNRHVVWDAIGYPDLGNESGYLDKGFDQLAAEA